MVLMQDTLIELEEAKKPPVTQAEKEAIYAKLQALVDNEYDDDDGRMCGCHQC